MADNKLEIDLILSPVADKKSGKKIEQQAGKTGQKAGKKFDKGFSKEASKGILSLGANLKTLGFAAAAIGIGKVFLSGIAAAERQEDAINSLNSALQITGKFSAKTSQSLQDYASSLQLVTKFGDEAIIETQALIQSLGNLDEKGLKRATKATVDLAAALKIDLKTAATLVGKAAAGEVGSFSRYGVSIKKAETNAITFTNALDALEKKFGGAAEKQLGTFAGATEQAGNSFGDLLEGLGSFITENPLVIKGINSMTGAFSSLASTVKDAAKSFNNLFKSDAEKSGLQLISEQVTETNQKLQRYRDILAVKNKSNVHSDFTKAAQEQIPLLEKLLKGLERRKKVLEETTSGGADGEDDSAANEKRLALRKQLSEKLKVIGLADNQILLQQKAAQLEIIRQSEEIGLLDEEAAKERRLVIEQSFSEKLKAIEDQRTLNSQASISGIADSFKVLGTKVTATSGAIAKTTQTVLAGGIGKAATQIGANLKNGEAAFSNFGDAVTGIFGDLASSIGDFYIKDGIAKLAGGYPGGGAEIAAGLGLKVLGGLLGGGGGSSSGAAAGGGGDSGTTLESNINSDVLQDQNIVQAEAQDNIQLVVQGSIFNTSETAKDLTKLLNENFESTGAALTNTRFA